MSSSQQPKAAPAQKSHARQPAVVADRKSVIIPGVYEPERRTGNPCQASQTCSNAGQAPVSPAADQPTGHAQPKPQVGQPTEHESPLMLSSPESFCGYLRRTDGGLPAEQPLVQEPRDR